MSMCRACRGARVVGVPPEMCERCMGDGALCDDSRGPDDAVTCEGAVRFVPGLGDRCAAHAPADSPDPVRVLLVDPEGDDVPV